MLNKFDKWTLFLSSFLPLYILIMVQDYKFFFSMSKYVLVSFNIIEGKIEYINPYKWIFFSFIVLLFLLSILIIYRFVFSKSNRQFTISGEFEKTGDSVISYIFTYLVPLLSMDINNGNSLLINFLLFIFIGIIYVSQDLIYLNPILGLLGYKVYINGDNIVITKFSLEKLKEYQENSERVKGNRIGADIYIYRKLIRKC